MVIKRRNTHTWRRKATKGLYGSRGCGDVSVGKPWGIEAIELGNENIRPGVKAKAQHRSQSSQSWPRDRSVSEVILLCPAWCVMGDSFAFVDWKLSYIFHRFTVSWRDLSFICLALG